MFKKTEKNIIFDVSDKTLNNTVRFTGFMVAGLMTIGLFGVSSAGAQNDVVFQLSESPLTSKETVNTVRSSGISRSSYPTPDKFQKNLEKNTFTITAQTDENGVPLEMLDESNFTPDGSHNWISCTKANVRTEPSVSSDKVSDVDYSSKVVRLSYGSSWSKIRLEDGTEGYVLSDLLSDDEIILPTPTPTPTPVPTAAPTATPVPKAQTTETTAATTAATTAETTAAAPAPAEQVTETELNITVYASCSVNLRSGASTDASLIRVLNAGDEITVVAETSNGWYKTALGNYVKASLTTTEKPAIPEPSSDSGESSAPNDLASYCLQYIGCSYVYAGASPSGFDCSGFVSYVYANWYGISLPHSADSIYQMGYGVSSDEMQPGDVVCNDHNGDGYIDHVSIYIGGGEVVHASTSTTGVIRSNFSDLKDVVSIRRLT